MSQRRWIYIPMGLLNAVLQMQEQWLSQGPNAYILFEGRYEQKPGSPSGTKTGVLTQAKRNLPWWVQDEDGNNLKITALYLEANEGQLEGIPPGVLSQCEIFNNPQDLLNYGT